MQTHPLIPVHRHPAWLPGAWFALSTLALVLPAGAMVLLLLIINWVSGVPVRSFLELLFSVTVLPPGMAFGMGLLTGPRILRLAPRQRGRAATWGTATGLGALLLWLLVQSLPLLIFGSREPATSWDVPGAAEAVGYLVVLPVLVGLCGLVGAVAGVLLHEWAARRKG